MPIQTETGKAFEYSIAKCYYDYFIEKRLKVELVNNTSLDVARNAYNSFAAKEKRRYDIASQNTIESLITLEPGLSTQKDHEDLLKIELAPDAQGQAGDVRDIIFSRSNIRPRWEIGFSAKNNHDAVKHSRLSRDLDFGNVWMGLPCSRNYFNEIRPVFDHIDTLLAQNPTMKWTDLGSSKENDIYSPVLHAFKKELMLINTNNSNIPEVLLSYLIGRFPFYKVIKDDKHNLVIVKAYNIDGKLNKTVSGKRARAKTQTINLPNRIIEFNFKEDTNTTLIMTLDKGWQISFRIHSATTRLEHSLKFDITLIGNPPILFTQHLFALD